MHTNKLESNPTTNGREEGPRMDAKKKRTGDVRRFTQKGAKPWSAASHPPSPRGRGTMVRGGRSGKREKPQQGTKTAKKYKTDPTEDHKGHKGRIVTIEALSSWSS